MNTLPPSLGRRIVASVGLGLSLILLLFGLVAWWTIQQSTELVYRERVTLAQVLARRVDDVLGYALATLEREAAALALERDRALTEGQRRHLAGLRLRIGSFSSLSVADHNGIALWTDPSRSEISIGQPLDHPVVERVLRSAERQVANQHDPALVSACLAVPLRDPTGRLAGVLMAEIDPGDPALNLVPVEELSNGMHAQLIDAPGRPLAGSHDLGPRAAREHARLLHDLIEARADGFRVHGIEGASAASHIVAYAPISLLPSWGMTVEQPVDLGLAVPRQFQERLVFFGLATLLLAVAVAWLDVRRVVRPLKSLTAAAERFAAGQLDEPLELDRSDELGILARAFDTMRRRLRCSLAEVAERNRNLAILEERERIAREMHDGLAQVLGYVNTKTLAVSRLLEVGKVAEARAQVIQLEEAARDVYSDVRETILGLRMTLDPQHDFLSALRAYLRGFEQQSGVAVELRAPATTAELGLSLTAEIQMLRIVQESLANVRKHAQAARALVECWADDGVARLTIEDDGRGFDPVDVGVEGEPRFGLQTMRERAEAIGGSFAVQSRSGAGTRVVIIVPREGQDGSPARSPG